MRDEELKKQSHFLESRAEGAGLVAPCTAQLAELNHLYQTTPIGLCLLDTDLRYVHINKVLADFNGCPVSEHIGRTLQEIIPDVFPFVASFFRQVLDTGEPFRNIEFRSATQSEPNRERDWLIDLYDYLPDSKRQKRAPRARDHTRRNGLPDQTVCFCDPFGKHLSMPHLSFLNS